MLVNGLLSLALNMGPGVSVEGLSTDAASGAEDVATAMSSKKDVPTPGSPLTAMAMMVGMAAISRRFKLQSGSITDVGNKKRANGKNEDDFFSDDAQGLYIVADGVGKAGNGNVAAAMAVRDMPPLVIKSVAKRHESKIPDVLRTVLKRASISINLQGLINAQYQGMSTTAVMLLIHGAQAYAAHVGDSRLYRVEAGSLIRMTQDHSVVQEEMAAGRMTEAQARVDPRRHMITSSLGHRFTPPHIDVSSLGDVKDGARFLLCSDGLTEMVEDAKILEILQTEKDSQVAAQKLIDEANQNGGHDNITVIVVDVSH